jgi:hypothetical protein
MSYASKKYTFGKSVPRSKEALAAEKEKHDADMKRYQDNAAFLAKVAEGEYASLKAQAEEAKYSKRYPFQACTFAYISSQFQPQLTTLSWK